MINFKAIFTIATALGLSLNVANAEVGKKLKSAANNVGDAISEAADTVGTAVEDSAITATIKSKYAKDKVLNSFDISVTTNEGVVTLEGLVNTDMQYDKAVMIAGSNKGVVDVETTNFKIRNSSSPLADAAITAKVKGSLIRHEIFSDMDLKYWSVSVTTKNNVVFLEGTVDNANQKANVISVAEAVKGVKSVDASALKIK